MSGRLLCVVPGPTEVIATEAAGTKWCFGCRQHLPHEWQLKGDPLPSYYEPIWLCRCSRCGRDRTQFPGTGW